MRPSIYQHQIIIPFQDIDAAGILFFAHLFRYSHEAYEQFMSAHHHSLADIIKDGTFLLPIVHAEADYKRPIHHSENITIELGIKNLGTSSFTIQYHLKDNEGGLRAVVETVHVTLDAAQHKPMPIPVSLRKILEHHEVISG